MVRLLDSNAPYAEVAYFPPVRFASLNTPYDSYIAAAKSV